jgi:hypothetical protein
MTRFHQVTHSISHDASGKPIIKCKCDERDSHQHIFDCTAVMGGRSSSSARAGVSGGGWAWGLGAWTVQMQV